MNSSDAECKLVLDVERRELFHAQHQQDGLVC